MRGIFHDELTKKIGEVLQRLVKVRIRLQIQMIRSRRLLALHDVNSQTLERDFEKEPAVLQEPIHLNMILNREVLTQHCD